jgi:hemerythrin
MSTSIRWIKDFELGIKEIDQHHRKLVDLINIVHHAHSIGNWNGTIDEVINELVDYAFVHFTFEEQYFEKFGYENAELHKREHAYFINKVKKFQTEWGSNPEEKKNDLLNFLNTWLCNHIMHSDRGYLDCFKRHGMVEV